MFQSFNLESIVYSDDFIQQWSGSYQGHNSGSINRNWIAVPGKDGVLQLQVNNGYNSLRHNPNSLYIDNRKLVLSAELAVARNTGNQTAIIGLMDKHLGELPAANGVWLQGTTSDNSWRAYSYKSGVLIDSGVVGTLVASSVFQHISIEIGVGTAEINIDGIETDLDLSNNFAAGLCFGLINDAVSWPSLMLDWVKILR